MKIWIVYSLVATVVAVAAGSFALGVVLSGGLNGDSEVATATEVPTEPPAPQPTEYRPRLTATEAASKARSFLLKPISQSSPSPDFVKFLLGFSCETRDFNENDLAWIVVCIHSDSDFEFTYAVDDKTGTVETR